MDARKLGIGAAFAGVGALALRSFGPKLHEKCEKVFAEKCSGAAGSDESEELAERRCCAQPTRDDAVAA